LRRLVYIVFVLICVWVGAINSSYASVVSFEKVSCVNSDPTTDAAIHGSAIFPDEIRTPFRQYVDGGVELRFYEIQNYDFRSYLLYKLTQDERFDLNPINDGVVIIESNEIIPEEDFFDSFEDFYNNTYTDFQLLSKHDIGEFFAVWKSSVDPRHFVFIMMDITLSMTRNDNDHCIKADPFCSTDFYEFESAYSNMPADEDEDTDFGCVSTPRNPSWYYMSIDHAGQMVIHMEGHDPNTGTARDIDFCMWGPYTQQQVESGVACNNLTSDKIIDCSFSAAGVEDAYLGYPLNQHTSHHNSGLADENNGGTINEHTPQHGEYYILMITNYSNQPCVIDFNSAGGSGTTDCTILPPMVENDGPYCVGETIQLTANTSLSATYQWSGPNSFTSTLQNPTITNCTLANAGNYTCTIIVNNHTSNASTTVVVLPAPVAGFTMSQSAVCKGKTVSFTNTSYNPSPGTITSWNWSFGDGSVSILQNPTHVYSTAGTYTVTLTVGNGACNRTVTHTITVVDSQTTDVYATSCGPYEWNGSTYTTSGTYCVEFPGSASEEPEPCDPNTPFNNDFENGLGNWTVLDQDGDGHTWFTLNYIGDGLDYNAAHTGNGWATSSSATPYEAYTPNNFLISPRTLITDNQHTVSFWANAQDVNWPYEYFGLAVSTTNPTAASFSMIQEWTMTRISGTWHHYTVDLSAYIGQQIYVAIRHYNCTNQFRLNVDDIRLVCTDGSSIPCDEDSPFNNNFEGSLGNWTTLDADHDGHTWYTLDYYEDDLWYNSAYTGTGWATSASALSEDEALNPNNYLISPRTLITANQHTLSFWASPQDPDWINEHFGVAVSTANTPYANSFTVLQDWTLSSTSWQHFTVDLSTYIGRQIYVAFRHYESPDQFRLNIDQVELLCSGNRSEPIVPMRGCDSIVCLHLTVTPEPAANFTAFTVCQGQPTQFTSTSTGQNITSYQWTFGDGQTGTGSNLIHTYAQAGTYQVTLTVSTSDGNCSDEITQTVTVNEQPTASFTANTVCQGQPTQFTSTSTGQNITSYQWTFGDGQTGTGLNPTHEYAQAGTYQVTLSVQSIGGCSDQVSQYITVNAQPTANFTATTVCQGQPTQFTSTSTGQNITSYQWTFGDGQTGTGANPTHNYAQAGTYQVTLLVQSTGGCSDQISQYITVNAQPTANFTATTICQGQPTQFTSTSTGQNITSYQWNFGDNSTGTGSSISHQYAQGGTYQVTLTVTTSYGCTDDITQTVSVIEQPTASFNASTVCEGEATQFTSTSTGENITSYQWNFGDGQNGTGPNPTHEYAQAGTYQVTLTVSTNNGLCTDQITGTVNVNSDNHQIYNVTACDSYTWTNGTGQTYTSSGTYWYLAPNAGPCQGADSLYLTINSSTTGIDTQVACESYTWINGVTYTQSTNTPTYTLTNAAGCDSIVTLHLTINHDLYGTYNRTICDYQLPYTWHGVTFTQAGDQTITVPDATADGCDSIVTLHLTVNYATHNSETQAACISYTWHGATYTASGDYTYLYTNGNGCPSADTLHLTIRDGTHNVYTAEACEIYTWNGSTYNTSGEYFYEYDDGFGCTGTDTLYLTINHGTHIVDNVIECDSYTWHGTTYTESGTYPYYYTSPQGCPSVDTLHLTINHGMHRVYTRVECESYTWHGTTYTDSGTYTYSYTSPQGCPSVDTLHLTINHGMHRVYTRVECESYTWHGTTYTDSGTYTYSYTSPQGCPSVDTLHLTINHGMHRVYTRVECESYTWHGTTYTDSGTYTYSYTSPQGCPSVDTLHLTINHGMHRVYTRVECESYTWHGQICDTTGTYTYSYTSPQGCPSVDTLHLTIYGVQEGSDALAVCEGHFPVVFHGHTFNASGSYDQTVHGVAAHGCDSVWHLTVTVKPKYNETDSHEMCQGDTYTWQGHTFGTTAGTFTETANLQSVGGCDSIVTMTVTVKPKYNETDNHVMCQGETFTWQGHTFGTTAGTFTETANLQSVGGCDSIVTMTVTV